MKYSVLVRIIIFLFIWLPASYSNPAPAPEITILTSALGKDGDKFPVELSKIWEPIAINLNSNSVEVAPNIKLLRIDLTEEKEFSIPPTNSWLDTLIKPDPRVSLKNIHNYLEQSKISGDFSASQPINETQLQANKEKYSKVMPLLFEIVQTKSSSAANQFPSITELLPELKKQIEQDIAAGSPSLKYAIFYRLPDVKTEEAVRIGTRISDPTQPPASTTTNCTMTPTTTTQPNWYAVIEIGAKGIKPSAMQFQSNKGKIQPNNTTSLDTQDVTPSDAISIPRVVQAVCEDINQFHRLYGDLKIYIVGSSSMATVKHRAQLVAAIDNAVHLPVDFITAEEEASYLASRIWASLPHRRCQSAVIDIGSGNVKGGYLQDCNQGDREKFVSFDIQQFGITEFSNQSQQKVDSKIFPTFIEAAKNTEKQLEDKLDEQIRTRPEFTNGKERIYLVGGAVWMANTLLCLDCPQYDSREVNTNKQEKYMVIKPSDIEELYRYVIQEGEKVCVSPEKNPYIKRNMDGDYNISREVEQQTMEKQKIAIQKVCTKFLDPRDLLSAAEILRAIKNKMGINENRHIFFMQNNLYTWSRQYLIDKIQ